ncbi:MAG: carbamate kinase [Pseudomonadota bacterium]
MPADKKLIILAIGGNSLIKDEAHRTVPDQYQAVHETCEHIAPLIREGHRVVITHGNGPQVGFILRRSELAAHELHLVPLDSCGADTQGAIGYQIQQAFHNECHGWPVPPRVVTVVTQVRVDSADPAFAKPSKPIGTFMDAATAEKRRTQEGWNVVEDAGRGYRRVVASPRPVEIMELDAIRTLIEAGFVVVAVGGGGIPVTLDRQSHLHGVDAVIDKDFATGLLAQQLGADLLVISTAVEQVFVNFGTPQQRAVDRMTLAEARQYITEGHFKPGSMLPKIQAMIEFVEASGKQALLTDPPNLERAMAGETGTWIVP